MDRVRIGMIGAGVHATNMLYPSLDHLRGRIEKAAVCDLVEERAREAARHFGFLKTYTDYRRMLEEARLDGVIVCLNGRAHPPVVLDCLERGVDVLVEKPMAITVEEARAIEELAGREGRIVMVEHQKRYSKAYRLAMELVREPEFGALQMIECKMHGKPYDTLFNLFVEWHIHGIDLVRAFAGDIRAVTAAQRPIAANRAAIAVLLEFESGAVGTLNFGSEGGFGRFCERLELVGDNWRGVIVENARDVIAYHHGTDEYYPRNTCREWRQDWLPTHANFTHDVDGYVGIIERFAGCILTREPGAPDARDERKALEAVYEILGQLGIPADWRYVESWY
jgi:predicted dehydrogenase